MENKQFNQNSRSPGKMRGNRQRPNSQHGAPAHGQHLTHAPRKVFNCIVDESALVAGVKKSTRNGIRQWVKNGQIRVWVPLYALEQLSRQKNASNKHGEDVRETLKWLDEATSKFPHAVTLQGAEDFYHTWAEVEKFVVPRTLFSESDMPEAEADADAEQEVDDTPDEDFSKLTLSDLQQDNVHRKTPASSAASLGSHSLSPSSLKSQRSSLSAFSPPTSPVKAASSPTKPDPTALDATSSSSTTVPQRLQPLFNYILWRIHQEVDPVSALESFIFLCNDQSKVDYAKGFEVRAKRLEQLREAIGREERDFKNRLMVLQRESQGQNVSMPSLAAQKSGSGEGSNRSPPTAPAAMMASQQGAPAPANVIDPDSFGRPPVSSTQPQQASFQSRSPRVQNATPQTSRGGQNGQNQNFAPRGNHRGNFRGPRGRGNFNGQGRGAFNHNNRAENAGPGGQIDPNSFSRPRGGGHTGRGGRKLWVPT